MVRRLHVLAVVVDVLAVASAVVLLRRVREAQQQALEARQQAWFWTPEWLAGEHQASADIAAGRFERFDDEDALFKALASDGDDQGRGWADRESRLRA